VVAGGRKPSPLLTLYHGFSQLSMKNSVKIAFKIIEIIGLAIFLCYLVASIANEVRK
jgi:hypothetical protein